MGVEIPKHGWKVRLDHVFPENRDQNIRPRIRQLIQFLPLFFRYIFWYLVIRVMRRRPFIDCVTMLKSKQMYGVPIGGIGGGTIGRGFRGEFCRFQILPGIYEYNTVKADQFILSARRPGGDVIYQKVLTAQGKPTGRGLGKWEFGFPGENADYCALYPRAWTEYRVPEIGVRVVCRQVSPVIPNDYKDSSIPAAIFDWTVENNGSEDLEVSIAFSFKNGTGESRDRNGGCWSEYFRRSSENEGTSISGVLIHQEIKKMGCTYALAAKSTEGVEVSYKLRFNPRGDGSDVWNELLKHGSLLPEESPTHKTRKGEELAAMVCTKSTVRKGQSGHMAHCLAWDMPRINFHLNQQSYFRRYTRYFGNTGEAGPELSRYALDNYRRWESAIEAWQQPILQDSKLPDWYKSALFNELYFVSDGGTVWVETEGEGLPEGDPRLEYGRFAYLEGQEYRMYNTYDVHFYASFALSALWPKLQHSLQYDMCKHVCSENAEIRTHLYDGCRALRKKRGTIPHDVGDPYEEPFHLVNTYCIHDVGDWRDLNLKFVLQVYRDMAELKSDVEKVGYVKHMWSALSETMDKAEKWDEDGDGLIENSGKPDQTYDSWVMTGPSAYCGSLWLASLYCMKQMSRLMGDSKLESHYSEILTKCKAAFDDKLWTGTHYRFDCAGNATSESIMADQLCGHWYLRASRVEEEVFPSEKVQKTLRTIFDYNVMKFKNGTMGPVNGMMPDGTVDIVTMQSEEMWTGVGYALAATMIHEGLVEEGFKTAEGIYRTVYERIGLGFETPEALYETKHYRAIGYMRPLSIWAMQLAWERANMPKKGAVVQWGE